MRGNFGGLVAALFLPFSAGCSPQSPPPAGVAPAGPAASAPAADEKRPHFESELVFTYTINGGTGSSRNTGTQYDDGKPFRAVEHWSTSVRGGPVTLDCEVAFVAHRGGKDLYRVKYTVGKDGGGQTRTSEAGYDGKRAVLLEDQYGTLALRPPSE